MSREIVAYKYVERQIQNKVASGSLRLGSQEYFRQLSTESVGDPSEGKATHRITGKYTAKDGDIRFSNHRPNHSLIKISGEGQVIFQGSHFSTTENYLIFCATTDRNDVHWKTKYSPQKDSLVVIKNFQELQRRIEVEISKQYEIIEAGCCRVEYGEEIKFSRTLLEGPFICRKKPKFSAEREVRAYFKVRGHVPKFQDVQIDPADLISIA